MKTYFMLFKVRPGPETEEDGIRSLAACFVRADNAPLAKSKAVKHLHQQGCSIESTEVDAHPTKAEHQLPGEIGETAYRQAIRDGISVVQFAWSEQSP